MKKTLSALSAGLVVLSLAGCVISVNDGDGSDWGSDWKDRQEENRAAIAHLDIGMSRDEVEKRMGSPDFTEAFSHDGSEYHVLHYRTQHRHSDGETTLDETTPLVFKDGALVGWGDTLYRKISRDARL